MYNVMGDVFKNTKKLDFHEKTKEIRYEDNLTMWTYSNIMLNRLN
jgi:hypothetical protein